MALCAQKGHKNARRSANKICRLALLYIWDNYANEDVKTLRCTVHNEPAFDSEDLIAYRILRVAWTAAFFFFF